MKYESIVAILFVEKQLLRNKESKEMLLFLMIAFGNLFTQLCYKIGRHLTVN